MDQLCVQTINNQPVPVSRNWVFLSIKEKLLIQSLKLDPPPNRTNSRVNLNLTWNFQFFIPSWWKKYNCLFPDILVETKYKVFDNYASRRPITHDYCGLQEHHQ